MRLLNTTTLELHEFNFDALTFMYAILSHRWRDDEVDFKELTKKRKTTGSGYLKIVRCCHLAKSRGFDWVWIDTCCIDKRSSSELSEAINSMFRWYTRARECYAFLDDVTLRPNDSNPFDILCGSEWFKRGWTLQEVIAPNTVIFLSKDWKMIGRKSKEATDVFMQRRPENLPQDAAHDWQLDRWNPKVMLDVLHELTSIPKNVLLDHRKDLRWQSVAEKMRWMAGRRTSRVEDLAYCMLGLFGISMSPVYGEGLMAFDRLQAKILMSSSDETIFAWDNRGIKSWRMLAQRPDQFSKSARIHSVQKQGREPYEITNQGLRIRYTPGQDATETSDDGRPGLQIQLNCAAARIEDELLCSLYLEQLTCGHYVRLPPPFWLSLDGELATDAERLQHQRDSRVKKPRPLKRRYSNLNSNGDVGGKGKSTVIIVHMGQEHHNACRMASNKASDVWSKTSLFDH